MVRQRSAKPSFPSSNLGGTSREPRGNAGFSFSPRLQRLEAAERRQQRVAAPEVLDLDHATFMRRSNRGCDIATSPDVDAVARDFDLGDNHIGPAVVPPPAPEKFDLVDALRTLSNLAERLKEPERESKEGKL